VQPFSWRCRAVGFSDSAVEAPETFLHEERWLASVVRLGLTEEMEYQVEIEEDVTSILFRFDVHAVSTTVLTWPLGVEIGLEPGPLPPTAHFVPEDWTEVRSAPPR
jgi:hypothetical protein